MSEQPHTPGESHHEESDFDFRGVMTFAGGLLAVAVVVYAIIFGLFRVFDARDGVKMPSEFPLAAAEGRREPPEPRLQTDPRQDLADLRAKEEELLGTYGWVDKNAGVVRIPIDAAMTLTLQRGLPARESK